MEQLVERKTSLWTRIKKYQAFYIMFLPIFAFYIIFHYWPILKISMAFTKMNLYGEETFIGWQNFIDLFSDPMFWSAFRNTIIISLYNLSTGMLCAIGFALLLNEIRTGPFKKFTQTVVYLPHFLSWVVTASIFILILSPNAGIINEAIKFFGGKPVYFMIQEKLWRGIFVAINRWKETGWGAIIYLAAITGIDPQLYEAAAMDGAGKLRQTWHITLPALQTTILVVLILHLSKIFDIFQSVFVMYNSQVYATADVIDTYTFRTAFSGDPKYSLATAVGLFKSVLAMILVIIANYCSKRVKGESIL